MEPVELDTELEELEIRLERLRGLYEQYFLGIEKIEPSVARKDVDRRIYVLRREKIRNTAKRFKLQTIIQRYNTFQQYWQRICREIENGTYKRHILRAERTFGKGELLTIAARRRLGHFSRISNRPAADNPETVPEAKNPTVPPDAAEPPPPSAPRAEREPQRTRLQTGEGKTATPNAPQYESLDLDMDFLGDWDPSKVPPKERRPAVRASAQTMRGIAPAPTTAAAPETAPTAVTAPTAPAAVPPAAPTAPKLAPPPKPVRPAAEALSRPKAAPQPKPEKPKSRPDAAPPPPLSEDRLRELHGRLVEAKRQTKDSSTVSLEGLAKSLKATEARLREQHKNRRIDFDVIIRDGKAVVKPIVR